MIDWSKPEQLRFCHAEGNILEAFVPKDYNAVGQYAFPVLVYYRTKYETFGREFYSIDGMSQAAVGNKNYPYNIIPRPKIDRVDFMNFFRDNERLSELTTDDRIEIFKSILPGADCITTELLEDLLNDYGVENILAIEYKETT